MQFAKILVPVDFSNHSTAAQEVAVEIAKAFGAKIWLLHCYQLHPGGVSLYSIAAPANYHDDVRDAAMCHRRLNELTHEVFVVLRVDTRRVGVFSPCRRAIEPARIPLRGRPRCRRGHMAQFRKVKRPHATICCIEFTRINADIQCQALWLGRLSGGRVNEARR